MLDYCGYIGNDIIKKHVIDNSCGDGAFLRAVVSRFCKVGVDFGFDLFEISKQVFCYLDGIDT